MSHAHKSWQYLVNNTNYGTSQYIILHCPLYIYISFGKVAYSAPGSQHQSVNITVIPDVTPRSLLGKTRVYGESTASVFKVDFFDLKMEALTSSETFGTHLYTTGVTTRNTHLNMHCVVLWDWEVKFQTIKKTIPRVHTDTN
jgi:hypothetical protein